MTTLVYGSIEWLRVVQTIEQARRDERDLVFTPSMPGIHLGVARDESGERP